MASKHTILQASNNAHLCASTEAKINRHSSLKVPLDVAARSQVLSEQGHSLICRQRCRTPANCGTASPLALALASLESVLGALKIALYRGILSAVAANYCNFYNSHPQA